MYRFIRPLLFRLDPETAHSLILNLIRSAGIFPPTRRLLEAAYAAPEKRVEAFGLTFKNPLGLAAGYDKDGVAVLGLSALGFGHIEIGTVTPRPQSGNPKPRLFRLIEDEAVINRMGFPGAGMQNALTSLRDSLNVYAGSRRDPPLSGRGLSRPGRVIIGVNLGKNAHTPLEEAAGDYVQLVRAFAALADYLVINVSSPNTVGLRRLQGRGLLESLLERISAERRKLNVSPPILIKLAPDLTDPELDDALDVILHAKMDGLIATNTTVERKGLRSRYQHETGGLSGRPLRERSEAMLEQIVARTGGRIPVISAGGIMSAQDARRRLDMGAALVQVYSGLVYGGPGLVKSILRSL